jgi:hypothetical protein
MGGNCGPAPLELAVRSVVTDDYGPSASFYKEDGFHMTEITITPNQQVIAPFVIVLDFDKPISKIGHTVRNIGAQLGGGPFTIGLHAKETVSTSIGPMHPLILVVWSLDPVTLIGVPHVEY